MSILTNGGADPSGVGAGFLARALLGDGIERSQLGFGFPL
jgi:hypothetical protein